MNKSFAFALFRALCLVFLLTMGTFAPAAQPSPANAAVLTGGGARIRVETVGAACHT